MPDAGPLRVGIEPHAAVTLEEGFWAPEFGKLLPRPVIAWRLAGLLPLAAVTTITPPG